MYIFHYFSQLLACILFYLNILYFSGFNSTLRGGNVTHHEYIQVGKGRDVGLNQISLFEAKIANGNGEQTMSRDIYRLGHRFDFFRMLSCYFTTVGFYFNTLVRSEKCVFKVSVFNSLTNNFCFMTAHCAYCICLSLWAPLSCTQWTGERVDYKQGGY